MRIVVATDEKGKVFSIVDTDSRWVGDHITVNAVNVNSSCFKCPLLGEEKNCLRGCPTAKALLYD